MQKAVSIGFYVTRGVQKSNIAPTSGNHFVETLNALPIRAPVTKIPRHVPLKITYLYELKIISQ
jgi:hypothetical protein